MYDFIFIFKSIITFEILSILKFDDFIMILVLFLKCIWIRDKRESYKVIFLFLSSLLITCFDMYKT